MQGMRSTQAGPKRQRVLLGRDLVTQVENGLLTKTVLVHKLTDHVEAVDADMVRSFPSVRNAWNRLVHHVR